MNLKKILSYIRIKKDTVSTLPDSQPKKQSKEYDLYKSIDDLWLWNWDKAKRTKELGYLIKLDDYETIPKYDEIKLNQLYISLSNEIMMYSDSNSVLIFKEKTAELLILRNKYTVLSDCLIALSLFGHNEDALKIIQKYFTNVKTADELESQLKGLKKKIEMKYAEYSAKYNNNDITEEQDIYEVLDSISQWRGGTIIDPRKITVKQYLVMIKNFNIYVKSHGKR